MRKIFFLQLIVFSVFQRDCPAQPATKTDSLLSVLKKQPHDTNRVHTLNALSRQYLRAKDMTQAKKMAAEALALAEKLGFKKGIANAYNSTGNIYNQTGHGYYNTSRHPEALKNYLAALRCFEKSAARSPHAYTCIFIGQVYWAQKKYPPALDYYATARKLFEELKDKNGMAAAYNNIGLVYENQGQFSAALPYYYDAIKMYEEAGNKTALIDRYFNIGFLFEDQGNYPEALKNHQLALKISEELGLKQGIAASNSNIGGVYNNQGNYPMALEQYQLALKLYRETGDPEGMAISYNNIGGVYIDLHDYPKAQQNLADGLTLSKELGMTDNTKVIYELMSKLDSATGNWEGAFQNYKIFIRYRDSLYSDENTARMTRVQLEYDFDKKEDSLHYLQALTNARLRQHEMLVRQQQQTILLNGQEFALLSHARRLQELQRQKDSVILAAHKTEAEKKEGQLALLHKEKTVQALELERQKTLKKYLAAGLVLLLVFTFLIYRNYRSRQQLKLQTLRNKIASDLHDDVGSTLSSISIFSQMAQKQSKEMVPLLESIGESSRKMLDAMADIVWSINPENDQFEKIILRMRSFAYELLGAKNIDFKFIADEEVAKMKLPMNVRKNLYLIFKEATNNLVKYSGADSALFTLTGEKNIFTLLIRDNGKGFATGQPTAGNGLKNMQKRAKEINAEFLVDSHPGKGTMIQLKVAV